MLVSVFVLLPYSFIDVLLLAPFYPCGPAVRLFDVHAPIGPAVRFFDVHVSVSPIVLPFDVRVPFGPASVFNGAR